MSDLRIEGARVVTCDGPDEGAAHQRLGIVEDGVVVCVDGHVVFVGPRSEAPSSVPDGARVVDAKGRVLLPGLIDPHTHLVFAGSRIDELARRMNGEDYRSIAAAGGGIKASVRHSRAASDEDLYALSRERILTMRRQGVTGVEAKSGYGLSTEHELRHLRVARRLADEGVARVTTSLLGAHALPEERAGDRAGYVEEVADVMVPEAAAQGLADAVDVYLDEGAFTRAEAARVWTAARAAGLRVRGHVGQFADLGGAEEVAAHGGLSADHLEAVSDAGLEQMAARGVRAVLLPGAWRSLRQTPPDAARLRAHGVAIAVGTDLNPGTSPMADLPLAAALAVRDAGVTLEEAVLAVTREAARAAGFERGGRIRLGWPADLALFDADDPRVVGYALGGLTARLTVLGGKVVHERDPRGPSLW